MRADVEPLYSLHEAYWPCACEETRGARAFVEAVARKS